MLSQWRPDLLREPKIKDLLIRDVPDKLAADLCLRALRHRRSLQGELMVVLELAGAELDGLGLPFHPAPPPDHISFRRGFKTAGQLYAEILSQRVPPMPGDPPDDWADDMDFE